MKAMGDEARTSQPTSPWTPEQVRWLRRLALLIGLFVVALFLWRIRSILPLFLLGFFLAYLLDPLVDRLQERGLSRGMATTVIFFLFALLAFFVLLLVLPPLIGQATELVQGCLPPKGRYYLLAQELLDTIERRILRGDLPPFVEQSLQQVGEQLGQWLLASLQGVLSSLSGLLSLILVPLIAFYALQIYDPLRERVRWWVPPEYREVGANLARDIGALVGRYVRGYLALCLVVGITDIAFLTICQQVFGMQFALAIGALGGASYAVPYFGALVTTLTGALAAYTTAQHHPVLCALVVAVGLIAINQVFDWLIMPKVVGQRVGLHPLTVLFAVTAGGTMMGILGMVLAVPVAGAIKLVLQTLLPDHFAPIIRDQDAAKMTATQFNEGGERR
ncbi:MAG: hypothetical protein PVTTEEND_000067 [Candidatus Fervidibacter sp.]|jgi:Predicted permease